MTSHLTEVGAKTSMPAISHLTVRVYEPFLRERVVALFKAGLADIAQQAPDGHTHSRITRFMNYAVPQFDDFDEFLCARNGGKLFLATTPSGDIVGMFAVLRSDKHVENDEVEFARISVASSWRKKGVCRLLHDHAIRYSRDILRAKTAYVKTLSAMTSNINVYTGLGFRKGYDNVLDHRGFDVTTNTPVVLKFWKPL